MSCDSMQIYKEMNIGTAKVTNEEMQGIKHYMIDIAEPEERFSVSDYKLKAEDAIKEIINKGKVPIVVGGTGLYVNSLIYNIEYPEITLDEKYRQELEEKAKRDGLETLYNEACKIDSKAMEKISPNDKKRIIRVLEIYKETGKTKTEQEEFSKKIEPEFDYYIFGINMDRQVLYERINKRVDEMMDNGLVEEVEALIKKHPNMKTSLQSIGYKETIEFLNGSISKNEMVEKIKQETRRYAKRQLTWFRKIENIVWLNGEEKQDLNIQTILKKTYT